jgi:hypothetical protein
MSPEKRSVRIDQIRISDTHTQIRDRMDSDHVAEIADRYQEDFESIPRVVLFGDDDRGYVVGDGWHRIHAAIKLGFREINALVHRGGEREAFKYALGANDAHGLKRSAADKRKAVLLAFEDEEIGKLSDRAIAELCRVSQPFVSKLRPITPTDNVISPPSRTGRDGRTRTAKPKKEKMGKAEKPAAKPAEPEPPVEVHPSSGNVFADLGLENPEELLAAADATPPAAEEDEGPTLEDIEEEYRERKAIQDDISDDDWVKKFDLYQLLPEDRLPIFFAEATRYRHLEDDLNSLKKRRKELGAKFRGLGPMHYRMVYGFNIKHPRDWKLCPPANKNGCGGTGTRDVMGVAMKCPSCKGAGYGVS